MPTDPVDVGLLSPVTAGHDRMVSDAAVLDALVTVEVALTRAWDAAGLAPAGVADEVSQAFGWRGPGELCREHGLDAAALAEAGVTGGNPVIPLVGLLRAQVSAEARPWVHCGATSQDILDTAFVVLSAQALDALDADLDRLLAALGRLALEHRDTVAAARTLTQHAVPTTWGARVAGWIRAVSRARHRLAAVAAERPVQLGGAAGTLASFVELAGREAATALPGYLEIELGLSGFATEPADAPWHTARWPVTELGDALVQLVDACGTVAADVATASRTEIAEASEGAGGGSSAMPQKRNPVASVLVRSAALRAPQLGATLHLAAALAVDERPDGAWHAEWPTLRELLRLALGAAAHTASLAEGLRIDTAAARRNVDRTGGLIVAERLGIVLMPLVGRERFDRLIAAATAGGDLRALVAALPEAADLDVDSLLDPAGYVGIAPALAEIAAPRASGNPEPGPAT